MIDLDALKAELEQQATNIDGNVMIEVAVVHSIIARHVAPVVTPELDAEARDVLAEGLQAYAQQFSDRPVLPMYTGHADAGLAALRDKGFAVVRTADVEAAMCDARSFRLQMKGWERVDGTPVYEMDDDTEERLEEAIR